MEFVEIVQTYLNFIKSCRDDLTFGTDFWNLKISVDKKKNCSLKEKNIFKHVHRHRSTPKVEWTLPFKCIQKLHSSDIKKPFKKSWILLYNLWDKRAFSHNHKNLCAFKMLIYHHSDTFFLLSQLLLLPPKIVWFFFLQDS